MRKHIFGLAILGLLILLSNCGGGGGGSSSSPGGSYRTNVEIVVHTRSASASLDNRIVKNTSEIPAGVESVGFTISASDMDTIRREVQVAGRTTIVESFQVPVGSNRLFGVEAIDSAGNVVYRGQYSADVGGTPFTVTVDTTNTDTVAPVFAGLSNIGGVTSNSVVLSWSSATDNLTPSSNLTYLVYMASSPGGENFSSPIAETSAGATSYTMSGLSCGTTYYFVVRAKDAHPNIDQNVVERSATTADCIAPTFAGLQSATPISTNQITLTWSAGTDNVTPSADLTYLIYQATSPGGENLSSPTWTTDPGVTSFTVSDLSSGTPYYFVVRARDAEGNIDHNTVEKSATTQAAPTLSDPTYSVGNPPGVYNNCDTPYGLGSRITFDFTYRDIDGDANAEAGASLNQHVEFQGGAPNSYDTDVTSLLTGQNGYNGSIHQASCARFFDSSRVVVTYTLTDGHGHASNALVFTIDRPAGAN